MIKPDYATLPEIMAYAREHKVNMGAAAAHFRDIGRMPPPVERKPVPDGYQLPPHTFRLTEAAAARADALHSREQVLAEAEKEFEAEMLDQVRRGGDGKKLFIFNSFAMPDGDYEKGYTMIPQDGGVIEIDASEFRTMPLGDDDEIEVSLPRFIE